jgi:hypothetical protein
MIQNFRRTIALVILTTLASCTLPKPETSPTAKEDLVYIPPSTGSLTGRWVPRSEVNSPTISPEARVSAQAINSMQTEGLKTTPSNPSMGLGGH